MFRPVRFVRLSLLLGLLPAAAICAAADWSLLHITDVHIDPQPARAAPTAIRGDETLRWIAEAVVAPHEIPPLGFIAPAPKVGLVTGDITEYGAIDDTWSRVEEAVGRIPVQAHYIPGNHDMTWNSIYHILRRIHGSENHGFDLEGVRFLCISSASPQEPVPSIDATTRTWMRGELDRLDKGTPVIVALHHPPHSDELANPAELTTLVDMLRDYNVVLFMYGHGHAVVSRESGGIPGVMGGSTFGKNAGYGLLVRRGDTLQYAYRYHQGDPADPNNAAPTWKKLLERQIPAEAPPRLFSITAPAVDAASCTDVLEIAWKVGAGLATPASEPEFRINGDEARVRSLDSERGVATLDVSALPPGAHLLTVTLGTAEKISDTRTRVFTKAAADIDVLWRRQIPAAIKAGPVFLGEQLVIGRTDGIVQSLDPKSGREHWQFRTGGEILGTPAVDGDDAIVFGSGDGMVYSLDSRGAARWRYEAGAPVYGWPLIADGVVYVGDNQGRMHALAAMDGAKRWVFERAAFSIESRALRWKDLLIFGAWDGHLYALDPKDGALRWKSLGPKASQGTAPRYYAPADCAPTAIDDTLFVCDRGYFLGTFADDGKLMKSWELKVAAITPVEREPALLARLTEGGVARLDADGRATWTRDVPAGRFPIPPTLHAGRAYVCSNRGLVSVLDATGGAVQWQYQATPGFYVMAPVAVHELDGVPVAFVAGMDGTLVAVRRK